MVRKYIRKNNRRRYPIKSLLQAVEDVKNGSLSGNQASKLYRIPRATLLQHVKGTRSLIFRGKKPTFTMDEEKWFIMRLQEMEKQGTTIVRKVIIDMVANYVRENNKKTPFTNNIPGTDWYNSFRRRHSLTFSKESGFRCKSPKIIEDNEMCDIQPISNINKLNSLEDFRLTPCPASSISEDSLFDVLPSASHQNTQNKNVTKTENKTYHDVLNLVHKVLSVEALEDENDVTGKKIAFQLRAMNQTQRLIADKLMADVMFFGRMGKLTDNSTLKIA